MSEALIVQNSVLEGPGAIAGLLRDDGFEIRIIDATREAVPSSVPAVTVIMGSPAGANDERQYLRDEEALVRRCVDAGAPVLGVCLGAQLIARALGARVYRGERAEIGFGPVRAEERSGLMAGLPDPFSAFHWHSDTFELPEGARRLASSDAYANQAFCAGSAVGLQFHLEADAGMIRAWLDAAGPFLARAGADAGAIAAEAGTAAPAVSENMSAFYRNFRSEMRF